MNNVFVSSPLLISKEAEEERETDRALGHDVNDDFVVGLSLIVSVSPLVKREEAIPVQLTGSLMPVPDVVMAVPDERDTEALSAELSPGA